MQDDGMLCRGSFEGLTITGGSRAVPRDQGTSEPPEETPEPAYSFEELCLPVRPELIGYANKLAGDRSHAEDIAQEALEHALRAWPRWRPRGEEVNALVRAWLYRIVMNVFVNHYGRKVTRRDAETCRSEDVMYGTFGNRVSTLQDPRSARASLDGGLSDEVVEVLATLSGDHKVVVELYYFQGMSFDEIAAELGVPKATVGTRLMRARKMLQAKLRGFAKRSYRIG